MGNGANGRRLQNATKHVAMDTSIDTENAITQPLPTEEKNVMVLVLSILEVATRIYVQVSA